jgi:hypothetical protein
MNKINVSKFARNLAGFIQCKEGYKEPHETAIDEFLELLPSGSGIDSGVQFDWNSTPEKLVFNFSYHHMNEVGYYEGWTEHKLIITPCLQHGYKLKITGRDRNGIIDYLYDTFSEVFFFDISEPTHKPQQTS